MDDLLDETKRKIWQSYWQNNNMGKFDLSSFIDSAHSVVPELSYDECCRMALENTWKEGINIPFSPDAFIAFCRRVVQEIKPQNVLIPLADGSETTIFVEDTQTDYIFQDITLEELARKHLSINIIEKIEAEKTYDLILSDLPLGPVFGKDTGVGCREIV